MAASEQMDQDADQQFMQRALRLAEQGLFSTPPNPRVGCVIVSDGAIIGEGYHQAAGGLHAEREALKQAGDKARGATAYINLEPCCHQGRTPPCTDALIDAGISKVVAAMLDPNPLVGGSGFEQLTAAGVAVEKGLLEGPAKWLNRGFISRMSRRRPWVMLKSAATLDGRTAAFDGQSKWITGADARAEVHNIRAASSAVITGIGTVLADDPQMNVRAASATRQPIRVLLDSKLRLPLDAKIIGADQNLVIFTRSEDQSKISTLTELGVEVIQQSASGEPLDLPLVLEELANWQCNEVLVEAGQTLSGSFLASGLVDEMILFYAGSVLGDQGKSMFQFDRALPFESRVKYRISDVKMIGADILVTATSASSSKFIGQTAADE